MGFDRKMDSKVDSKVDSKPVWEASPPPFSFVFVYRLDAGALEAMSSPEPGLWVAKERLGESEQVATTED
jgi:hypothetical protein